MVKRLSGCWDDSRGLSRVSKSPIISNSYDHDIFSQCVVPFQHPRVALQYPADYQVNLWEIRRGLHQHWELFVRTILCYLGRPELSM